MRALRLYSHCLETRPILTKAVSGSLVFALGDYLCQKIENKYIFKTPQKSINWHRVLKQTSFGFVMAPYLHLQYNKIIPWLFPETAKYSIAKGVAYAVTLSDGFFNFTFFLYMGYMNDRSLNEAVEEVPKKFVPVQINNMKIWPFITGFNFTFVPSNYRVLFDNFMCIFWNIYLSYVENTKFLIEKKDGPEGDKLK